MWYIITFMLLVEAVIVREGCGMSFDFRILKVAMATPRYTYVYTEHKIIDEPERNWDQRSWTGSSVWYSGRSTPINLILPHIVHTARPKGKKIKQLESVLGTKMRMEDRDEPFSPSLHQWVGFEEIRGAYFRNASVSKNNSNFLVYRTAIQLLDPSVAAVQISSYPQNLKPWNGDRLTPVEFWITIEWRFTIAVVFARQLWSHEDFIQWQKTGRCISLAHTTTSCLPNKAVKNLEMGPVQSAKLCM